VKTGKQTISIKALLQGNRKIKIFVNFAVRFWSKNSLIALIAARRRRQEKLSTIFQTFKQILNAM
jgi:hypothetical protein